MGYWAAESPENIGKEVINVYKNYRKYLAESGRLSSLRKSYKTFFGNIDIQDIGGGIRAIHVNNYASLIRNLHVMVTNSRPAWQPRAINSDVQSQASADLADGLLDFYMREKGIEKKINEATLLALYLKEGWLVMDWDVNAGEPIAADDESGHTIFQGDVSIDVHTMIDVARDINAKNPNETHWHIVRKYVNKYDIISQRPDFEKNIESLEEDSRDQETFELVSKSIYNVGLKNDLIPMYVLYHKKTPAIPEGRLTIALADDMVLFDGPLPYKKPYCMMISTGIEHETAFGHSNMFDILPLQDGLDMTFSAIITNQAANAVQNFQMPMGAKIQPRNIADGMRVLEFDPKAGKIEILELLKTQPEVFNFIETINSYMQLIPNIGSVSRGEAPATMSGTAMALLQQQTIQASSGLQLSHSLLLESLGTGLIELLQEFAEEPRIAFIAGKTKKPLMKHFSGKDLMGVSRVIVDTANPLTKTAAGRVEIANQLLQTPGMIKNPEQYISVLTTGQLDPIYEYEKSMQTLIRSENEAMMNGEQVQAVLTDDPSVHCREHLSVLNSLDARKSPEVIQNVLNHIQQHIDLSKQIGPELAALIGFASFAPAPNQMVGPQQGQGVDPAQLQSETPPVEAPLPQPAEPPQL